VWYDIPGEDSQILPVVENNVKDFFMETTPKRITSRHCRQLVTCQTLQTAKKSNLQLVAFPM
jgi:hypothetical protein